MPAGSASRAPRVSRPVADMPTMGVPIRPVTPDDVVTIGVAVEVPDPHGAELQRWRADFGDPLANAIPAHVTLLPPTVVPPSMTPDVVAHLAEVAARTKPFVVRLRGTGSFRPVSPVVFVRVYAGAAGCDALQQRVRTGPLDRELSFPYHPHVTVAHHLAEPDLDRAQSTLRGYAADFTVSSIGLYEHGADSVWRLAHRFPFLGGKTDAGGNGANGSGASDGADGAADGRRP
jgi:2'-5' RNA ligase